MRQGGRSQVGAWALIAMVLESGCGIGTDANGGDGVVTNPADGDADFDSGSEVVARGPITAFGSILVDGISFDTTAATLVDDGVTLQEDALSVGEIVRVEGELAADANTAVAQRVARQTAVRGPVTALDPLAESLRVLGRRVRIDDGTVFGVDIEPRALSGLAPGEIVSVWGYAAANGGVLATRIERETDERLTSDLEVEGEVMALDTGAAVFELGALEVAYGNASLEGFDGGIASGDQVEVRGELDGSILRATIVRRRAAAPLVAGGAFEQGRIEGLVTQTSSAGAFEVGGQPIATADDTEFVNGSRASVALGQVVFIVGRFETETLQAQRVVIVPGVDLVARGRVDRVDRESGTVEVLGTELRVSPRTQLEDEGVNSVGAFDLADLRAGDFVDFRATALRDGRADLRRLARQDRDDRREALRIRGEVEAFDRAGVRVNGMQIGFNDATTAFVRDGREVSREVFEREVAIGDVVRLESEAGAAGALSVSRIEAF